MRDHLVARFGTAVPACGCAHAGYEACMFKEPISRLSGQQGAKDIPSWCQGQRPTIYESGADFAKRLLDEKYGL